MPVVTCVHFGERKRQFNASEWYRVDKPLLWLNRFKGWATRTIYFEEILERGPHYFMDVVLATDLFVFPRWIIYEQHIDAMKELMQIIRSLGKKMVYEVDDDYTNEFRVVHDGHCRFIIEGCDAITTTTKYLGERMREWTGKPYYVLPNMLDPRIWKDGSEPERVEALQDKIIISIMGTPTHEADWIVLEKVLPAIADRYPVHIYIVGNDIFEKHPSMVYLDFLEHQHYAALMRGSDIVLAPVDPGDRFNDSKSFLKATQGQGARRVRGSVAMGAAVIATNNSVYRLGIQNNRTGLLVEHNPESWYNAIEALVLDEPLRTSLQRVGYKYAWKHHDISRRVKMWADTYRRILE